MRLSLISSVSWFLKHFTLSSAVDLSHLVLYIQHLPYVLPGQEMGLIGCGNKYLGTWLHSTSTS